MTAMLLLVIAAGALLGAGALVRVAIDLRALRGELLPDLVAALRTQPMLRERPLVAGGYGHSLHTGPKAAGSLATWEWREGGWKLLAGDLPAEVPAGAPPAYPGAFAGEVVKTWTADVVG